MVLEFAGLPAAKSNASGSIRTLLWEFPQLHSMPQFLSTMLALLLTRLAANPRFRSRRLSRALRRVHTHAGGFALEALGMNFVFGHSSAQGRSASTRPASWIYASFSLFTPFQGNCLLPDTRSRCQTLHTNPRQSAMSVGFCPALDSRNPGRHDPCETLECFARGLSTHRRRACRGTSLLLQKRATAGFPPRGTVRSSLRGWFERRTAFLFSPTTDPRIQGASDAP